MFTLSVSVLELVFRSVVIYFALLFAFRLTGKKRSGEMSAFDLMFLLIISESVQGAMNADDRSVTGGVVVAATLIAVNYFVSWLGGLGNQRQDYDY